MSEVSVRTLEAQGGPMSDAEIDAFRVNPDWRLAVAIAAVVVLGALAAATSAVQEAVLAPVLGAALIAVTLTTLLVGSLRERKR